VPAPSFGSEVLTPPLLASLVSQLRAASLEDERRRLLRILAVQYRVTCEQLGPVLDALPYQVHPSFFPLRFLLFRLALWLNQPAAVLYLTRCAVQKERLAAAELLGPLVADRKGGVVRLSPETLKPARREIAAVLAKHDVNVADR
jgi:hypothetical protein